MNKMIITEEKLAEQISLIEPPDEKALKEASERQAKLAKPPGSLGKLEGISIKLAGISGKMYNSADRQCILIMSADNGVVQEGVSSAPQSVTLSQTINFTRLLTGVGALAKTFGISLMAIDCGIAADIPQELKSDEYRTGCIVDRKIAYGTGNIARGDAMTREQAVCAIENGIEAAGAAKELGYDIIGVGEMGIGNTTTASSVERALTGLSADDIVGRGGGINDSSFARKKMIVSAAGAREFGDVIDVLAGVGGFDICAMAGAYIGAALYRIPAVIDGYISAVAALAAAGTAPACTGFMFGSHKSAEIGYSLAMKELGLSPLLDMDMRLGEGSGCALAFQIIKGACGVMKDMATFEEAAINDDYLEEIRNGGCF